MKYNELIEGQYYISDNGYLLKATSTMENCDNIQISYDHFYNGTGSFTQVFLNFEKASDQDSYWLEECIKNQKFIKKSHAMMDFSKIAKIDYNIINDLIKDIENVAENSNG